MKSLRLLLVLAAVLPLGGCFQSSTVLKVNGDGSGTIEQSTVVTNAALAQLRSFAALGGGKPVDPISEEQLRSAASTLGSGVTFVSSRPIKTPEGEGRAGVYAFTDINHVHISQRPAAPGGVSMRAGGLNTDQLEEVTLNLTRTPAGTSLLNITFPESSATPPPAGSPPADAGLPPDQLAMFTQVLAGLKLAIAVQPNGQLVRTSSPYVDGQKVVLLDLDFNQLQNDPTLLGRLQGVKSIADAKVALQGVPGVKATLEREVTIEFTPAK